ncbi:MAG TPA: hypothetical protein VGM90_30655 [Kofleriaceae bacterium]
MMVRLAAALSFLTIAGCYSPSIAPCIYECNGDACPSGLTCNRDINMCVATATDSCNGDAGTAIDAVPLDTTRCGWPGLSNVDPCALHADTTTDTWAANGIVNTDLISSFPTSITPVDVEMEGGKHALAIPLQMFSVASTQSLKVMGERPLIIVTRMAMINGPILVSGAITTACPGVIDGMTYVGSGGTGSGSGSGGASGSSGGGAGGSYGARGGNGGTGNTDVPAMMNLTDVPAGTGGNSIANPGPDELIPLRGGCAGGKGGSGVLGSSGLSPGGAGGAGGGAIQISSNTEIVLGSAIIADGAGGIGVTAEHAGGGGGGAGGAILLEAPLISYGNNANLCANGGGGGTGGNAGHTGKTASTCEQASGGAGVDDTTPNNGGGGAGGFSSLPGQRAGENGNSPGSERTPAYGGGGGGGGVGKIRVNGQTTGAVNASPAVSSGALGS